jgi:hypothetical protein
LGLRENLNNTDLKPIELKRLRKEAGNNDFYILSQRWIESFKAKGIISNSGGYNGLL